eukprot:GDKJ01052900.1.p1 GENE.GDKJ01052900.1~~GDKJ01052900.1.p1  ORF type:complete len:1420 (+),score=348.12 GDKJ01052900.1:491-4261(+)
MKITSTDATGKSDFTIIRIRVFPADRTLDVNECQLKLHKCPDAVSKCADSTFATSNNRGYNCVPLDSKLVFNHTSMNVELPVVVPSPTPVNECLLRLHGCHTFAECLDEPVGYKCQCVSGYNGDGLTCAPSVALSLASTLPKSELPLGIEDLQTIAKMGGAVFETLMTEKSNLKFEDIQNAAFDIFLSMSLTSSFAVQSLNLGSGQVRNETQLNIMASVSVSQLNTMKSVVNAAFLPMFDNSSPSGSSSVASTMKPYVLQELLTTSTALLGVSGASFSSSTTGMTAQAAEVGMQIGGFLAKKEVINMISPSLNDNKDASGSDSVLLEVYVSEALAQREVISDFMSNTLTLKALSFGTDSLTDGEASQSFAIASSSPGEDPIELGFSMADTSVKTSSSISSKAFSAEIPLSVNAVKESGCQQTFTAHTRYPQNIYSEALLENNASGSMLSLNVFGLNCADGVKMKQIHVEGLQTQGRKKKDEPIIVKMEGDLSDPDFKEKAVCGFYESDTFTFNWKGCLRVPRLETPNGNFIMCECSHLTDFSSVTKSVVMSTNLDLLGRIGELIFDVRNFGFWLVLAFTIFAFLVMARAMYRDIKYPITNESLLLVYCNDKLIIEKLREQDQEEEAVLDGCKKKIRILFGKEKADDVDDNVKSIQVVRAINAESGDAKGDIVDHHAKISTMLQSAVDIRRDKTAAAVTKIARAWRRRQARLKQREESPDIPQEEVEKSSKEKTFAQAAPPPMFRWSSLIQDEIPDAASATRMDSHLAKSFNQTKMSSLDDSSNTDSESSSLEFDSESSISSDSYQNFLQNREMSSLEHSHSKTSIYSSIDDTQYNFKLVKSVKDQRVTKPQSLGHSCSSTFTQLDRQAVSSGRPSLGDELYLHHPQVHGLLQEEVEQIEVKFRADDIKEKRQMKKKQQIDKVMNSRDVGVEIVAEKMSFASWSILKLFRKTLEREHPIAGQAISFRRSSVELALKYGSALIGGLFLMACFFGVDEQPESPIPEGHKDETVVEPDIPLIVIPMPFDMSFLGPFEYAGINITLKGLLTSILCWMLGQMIPFIVDMLFSVETPYIKRLEEIRSKLKFSISPKTGLIPVTLMTEEEQVNFCKKRRIRSIIGIILGTLYSLFCLFFLFIFVLALGADFKTDSRFKQTADFFFTAFTTNLIELVVWPVGMAFLITFLIKAVFSRTRKLDRIMKLRPDLVSYESDSASPRDCRRAQTADISLTAVMEGSDGLSTAELSTVGSASAFLNGKHSP